MDNTTHDPAPAQHGASPLEACKPPAPAYDGHHAFDSIAQDNGKPRQHRSGQRPLDTEGNVLSAAAAAAPITEPPSAQRRRSDDAGIPAPAPVENPRPRTNASMQLALIPPALTPDEIARRQAYMTQRLMEAHRLNQRKRSIFHRLTPVSWVSIGVVAVMLASGALVSARALTGLQPNAFSATEIAVAQAAPTATARIIVVTATAAPVASATNVPVQAAVAPAKLATPEAAPVQPTPAPTLEPTQAPTAAIVPTSEPGAPWASQLTADASGALMAPEDVVLSVRQSVQGYFESIKAHRIAQDAKRDLLDNQEAFLSQFFDGEALNTLKTDLNSATQVPVYERGDVTIRVTGFSADGMTADVVVEQRGWTTRFFERKGLQRWLLKRIPDQDMTWRLSYSPADKRWRVVEFVESQVLKRERPVRIATRAPQPRKQPIGTPVARNPSPELEQVPTELAVVEPSIVIAAPQPLSPP